LDYILQRVYHFFTLDGVRTPQITLAGCAVCWSQQLSEICLFPNELSALNINLLSFFFYLTLTSFYVITVGIESYCRIWWHSGTHTNAVRFLWMRDGLGPDTFTCTTHNNYRRQTSMLPAGFEPAITASERPQTHACSVLYVEDSTGYDFFHRILA